jgi:hypothetical protein
MTRKVFKLFPKDPALYAILTLAFALRVWGIWNVTTTDEYNEVFEALRVCSGHLNLERWGKRFYLYILAVEYGIYYSLGWVCGIFQNPLHFAEKIVRNMEPLLILGRITSVVTGALTVAVVYQTGKRYFNDSVAVIASCLLAVTVFHVDLSQQAKVDALLGLLVALTLYYSLKLLKAESVCLKDYACCGLFAALAIQTKFSALPLLITISIVIISAYSLWRERAIRPSLVLLLFFVIGSIVGNPAILMSPISIFKYIINMTQVYTTPMIVVPADVIGFVAYPIYFYKTFGAFNLLLAMTALLYACYGTKMRALAMLSFVIIFYVQMGASRFLVAPYYLIPVMPFIVLMMAECVVAILSKLRTLSGRQKSLKAIGSLLIIMLVFLPPTWNTLMHEISLTGKNTRYLAKEWIEANIPSGSKILMDSGKSFNSYAPTIAENRESIERMMSYAKDNISQGKILQEIVDKNAIVYYEMLLKTVPEKSYDITSTMYGLQVNSIDYYLAEGYQYFIISSDRKESRSGDYAKENIPDVARFYDSLDTDHRVNLIHVIAPTIVNKGDTFLIYKLNI